MKMNLIILCVLVMNLSFASQLRADEPQRKGPVVVVIAPKSQYTGNAQDLSVWCNDTLADLRRAANSAIRKRDSGDFCGAVQDLRSGLDKAAQNIPLPGKGLFTANAIDRGKSIIDAISQSIGNDPAAPMTELHFLFEYYGFIERISEQLDTPYYLPYVSCGRCSEHNPYSNREFEKRFISLGKEGLMVVLRKLAEEAGSGRSRSLVYPIGPSGAFLSALATQALYTAQDLRQSTYANRYACTINDLNALSSSLQNGDYGDEVSSVTQSYYEARTLANEIESQTRRCDRNDNEPHSSYSEPIRIERRVELEDTDSSKFIELQ